MLCYATPLCKTPPASASRTSPLAHLHPHPDDFPSRKPSRVTDSPLDGIRPWPRNENTLHLVDRALDGIPTGRGPGAEDGGVAELLANVLEPFTVLGLVSACCQWKGVWGWIGGGGELQSYLWVLGMGRVAGV